MYRQPEFSRRAHVGIVVVLYALLVTAPLVLPMAAIAGGIELDSREYKLMLKPDEFTGADPLLAVRRFTAQQLVPTLREQWNGDAATELASSGMQIGERRIIRFWDSGNCLLYRHGFAWRRRTESCS